MNMNMNTNPHFDPYYRVESTTTPPPPPHTTPPHTTPPPINKQRKMMNTKNVNVDVTALSAAANASPRSVTAIDMDIIDNDNDNDDDDESNTATPYYSTNKYNKQHKMPNIVLPTMMDMDMNMNMNMNMNMDVLDVDVDMDVYDENGDYYNIPHGHDNIDNNNNEIDIINEEDISVIINQVINDHHHQNQDQENEQVIADVGSSPCSSSSSSSSKKKTKTKTKTKKTKMKKQKRRTVRFAPLASVCTNTVCTNSEEGQGGLQQQQQLGQQVFIKIRGIKKVNKSIKKMKMKTKTKTKTKTKRTKLNNNNDDDDVDTNTDDDDNNVSWYTPRELKHLSHSLIFAVKRYELLSLSSSSCISGDNGGSSTPRTTSSSSLSSLSTITENNDKKEDHQVITEDDLDESLTRFFRCNRKKYHIIRNRMIETCYAVREYENVTNTNQSEMLSKLLYRLHSTAPCEGASDTTCDSSGNSGSFSDGGINNNNPTMMMEV